MHSLKHNFATISKQSRNLTTPSLSPRTSMSTSTPTPTSTSTSKDWNPTHYLKFNSERTRPARDLLASIPSSFKPKRIIDLGCGPGNSTALLVERFGAGNGIGDVKIEGVDSSASMIEKARASFDSAGFDQNLKFEVGDLTTWSPSTSSSSSETRSTGKVHAEENVDLFFSNAVLHWLPSQSRFNTITRLLQSQSPGSYFAFQIPNNLSEPSHVSMRDTASSGPWAETLKHIAAGRDEFETPNQIYDLLKPEAESVDIWETTYFHWLKGPEEIVAMFGSTGLRPFLEPLDDEMKKGFLERYEEFLRERYPRLKDGGVLLRFPRLFVVARR